MRRCAALLVLLAIAGCAERPRSNPFDPGNPSTGGRPAGFVAVAETDRVILRWEPSAVGGAVAYQLYRRVSPQGEFEPLGPILPSAQTRYDDLAVSTGRHYDYRLFFVLSGSPTGLPAEDWAEPGPRRVWFSDLQAGALARLSADAHRVAASWTGFYGPTQVAFDGRNRRVWVSDTYDGTVISIDADGASRIRITGLTEPVAIAIDSLRDRMWVCDQARDAVFQYRLDGFARAPFQLAVDTPIGVAHDPVDGSIWVCERGGNRLRHFSGSGTPFGAVDLLAPSRVAVDSVTQDAWVTSFEGAAVYRVSPQGVVSDTIPMSGPIGIAIDARSGRIWVADAAAGAVVALRRSGVVEFRVTGLPRVRELTVELSTGECFATVPGGRSVSRISPAGIPIGGVGNQIEPYGIAIEP